VNTEERTKIMSINCPEKIRTKWEETGLFEGLDSETANKISQLCENQARHLIFAYGEKPWLKPKQDHTFLETFLMSLSFPAIRRIFGGMYGELWGECEIGFTFETSVVPAFTYVKPDGDPEEPSIATIHIHKFESCLGEEEMKEITNNGYYGTCGELDLIQQLSERFFKELNEKHTGKHLIFGYPFIITKNDNGEETLGYRCAVLPGGSKLVDGKYKAGEKQK